MIILEGHLDKAVSSNIPSELSVHDISRINDPLLTQIITKFTFQTNSPWSLDPKRIQKEKKKKIINPFSSINKLDPHSPVFVFGPFLLLDRVGM